MQANLLEVTTSYSKRPRLYACGELCTPSSSRQSPGVTCAKVRRFGSKSAIVGLPARQTANVADKQLISGLYQRADKPLTPPFQNSGRSVYVRVGAHD